MRVYPEKLAGQLQQQLLPVYLISGDEPLLVQECCDQVRRAARNAGCTDREVIDAVRVEARIRKTLPSDTRQDNIMSTFYLELGPEYAD